MVGKKNININRYIIVSGHLCSVKALGLVHITQCSPSVCTYISDIHGREFSFGKKTHRNIFPLS